LLRLPKLENGMVFIALLLVLLSIWLYSWLKPNDAAGLASFLGGISTIGIFILTAFYVIYTNRQLREIQKQRLLNIQPLPNINIIGGMIAPPRLVVDYADSKGQIEIVVDVHIKLEMKNIGNGTAVLVDAFSSFVGKKITYKPEHISAHRFPTLEQTFFVKYNESLRDEKFEVLNALNTDAEGKCFAHTALNVLLRYSVLYRNIVGASFLTSIDNIIAVSDDETKIVSEWLGHINSFKTVYAADLENFRAVYKRDRKAAMADFEKIEDKFYKHYKVEPIDIQIMPLSQSFKIQHLDKSEEDDIAKKIYHGIPLGRGSQQDSKEIQEWKQEILKPYFDDKYLT